MTINRYLFATVSAVMMAAGTSFLMAEVPHMAIGYTGEELPMSSTIGISDEGILKAATLVDPSDLGDLTGLQIMGFNVGLASRINLGTIHVWATESLDSEPLASVTIDGRPEKGWNTVTLPELTGIPCAPLYIGYTIETTGASYPVAAAGLPNPDGLWLDTGAGWENLSESAGGMLAMSVILTADNLPPYNLTLIKADIPTVMHSVTPTPIPIEVRNSGSMTVNGFTLTCSEGEGMDQEFPVSASIAPNERLKMVLEVMPLSRETETPFEFTVTISSIDGGEDSNPADNSISAMTRVSRFTFIKRLLVEEFTTMQCVNCPRAAKLLHQALQKEEYADRVFGVCHHSGYYTDMLTQPCDEEMLVLYGEGGSYAPAMMFDRLKLDEGAVAVNVPLVLEGLTGVFDEILETTAEVDLNLSARWNPETSMLDIDVEGGCALEMPPADANRITVYVLENDINTPQQAGGGSDYMQQHVIRAYNSTWGEEIDWQGDGRFSYSVSLALPEKINPEHMEVVGLISHYNPVDVLDCAVANSARAPKIDWSGWSGIEDIAEEQATVEYYDLMGNRVAASAKGLLIKVSRNADGSFSSRKVITY